MTKMTKKEKFAIVRSIVETSNHANAEMLIDFIDHEVARTQATRSPLQSRWRMKPSRWKSLLKWKMASCTLAPTLSR